MHTRGMCGYRTSRLRGRDAVDPRSTAPYLDALAVLHRTRCVRMHTGHHVVSPLRLGFGASRASVLVATAGHIPRHRFAVCKTAAALYALLPRTCDSAHTGSRACGRGEWRPLPSWRGRAAGERMLPRTCDSARTGSRTGGPIHPLGESLSMPSRRARADGVRVRLLPRRGPRVGGLWTPRVIHRHMRPLCI